MAKEVDIVYLSHNRLHYTWRTLPRLLDTIADPSVNITVVDNGSDQRTVDYLMSIEDSRLLLVFNRENQGIGPVMNRIWTDSTAKYVGKVDNDTLVPHGWLEALIGKLEADERLAVASGFHFLREDLDLRKAAKNVDNGVLLQPWVGGCAYLAKAEVLKRHGGVQVSDWKLGGWTEYQKALTDRGYKIGYVVDPLVKVEHFDDPRHPEMAIDPDYLLQTRGMTVAEASSWYRADARKLLYSKYRWTKRA